MLLVVSEFWLVRSDYLTLYRVVGRSYIKSYRFHARKITQWRGYMQSLIQEAFQKTFGEEDQNGQKKENTGDKDAIKGAEKEFGIDFKQARPPQF